MTTFNPYLDFLEGDETGRKAAYFSYGDRFGGAKDSQRQRSFFQDQFSEIYDRYLGSLGLQVRQGKLPTGGFNDYMGGFDFEDWYRKSQPYEQRNQGFSSFVPRTKFVNPYYEQR